ncbi:hypothetical protein ACWF7H_14045 [Peribacillus butanolivorans]|uniref:hypothetical protein n=1 Tax=Peribacillus butanolivorans TaxID=421767 RepID=UPI0036B1D4EB
MQILELLVLASDLISVIKELSNFIPLDLDNLPFIIIFGYSYPSKIQKKTAI